MNITQEILLPEKKFKLTELFIEQYRTKKPPFGFNGLGEVVYLRTYSRIKDNGKNEKWFETVRRVVEGTYNMQKKWIENHQLGWNSHKAQLSAQEMYERIFNMKFLPPGRGLWAMGSSITEERGIYAALNNCAFVSTEDLKTDFIKPFLFLMDMSMLGVGVGFDTKGVNTVLIKGQNKEKPLTTFIIEDTRESWVESLGILLNSFLNQYSDINFDYSKIRKAGELIKGFGGRSSGPQPLIDLHNNIRKVLNNNAGKPITITSIVDIMNYIGICVVAGNVRRTAEITFGDYNSEEYLDLKNYKKNPHRAAYGWTSNNTIFADLGMDYTNAAERTAINGEPGYAWLENMKNYSRMNNGPDFKDRRVSGGNPSLRVGTKVLTDKGIFNIEDLQDKEFLVKNLNNEWSKAKCFLSGKNKKLIKITLQNKFEYYATEEHEWPINGKKIKSKDLKIGYELPINKNDYLFDGKLGDYDDGFLYGWILGDGWFIDKTYNDKPQVGLIVSKKDYKLGIAKKLEKIIKEKTNCKSVFKKRTRINNNGKKSEWYEMNTQSKSLIDYLNKFGYPSKKNAISKIIFEKSTEDFRKGLINGLFSSDGCFDFKEYRLSLVAKNKNFINSIGELLGFYGIRFGLHKRTIINGKFPNLKDYKKSYNSYQLRINDNYSLKHFFDIFKIEKYKNFKFNKLVKKEINTYKIINIQETELREDVWDITVYDSTHCFQLSHCITGNCLEQSLESFELCCLVETFPFKHDSLEDYVKTLKYAYLYAKTVTLGKTHWAETNRVLLRNRRIGCSMSGIIQFLENRNIDTFKQWCEKGYSAIESYDKLYSDWFAIPKSIKTTSIKPSGSVSLLAGATPGCHWPKSKYYIRRIILSKTSDLVKQLKDAGFNVEDSVTDKSSVIVEFPICSGENIRTEEEVSIWEKVSLAAFLQKHWADNQVSCTVTFNPNTEGKDIKNILNYFQYQLKGISFLPILEQGAYAQMPYETITKEKYESLMKNIKKVHFNNISGEEANVEKFCDGESCII